MPAVDEPEPFEPRHRARNVPHNFNLVLERQRLILCGDGSRPKRHQIELERAIRVLRGDELSDVDRDKLAESLLEIRLRYLVLSKTLDKSVPPTPIMKELKSLEHRLKSATRTIADDDRDEVVRELSSLSDIPNDFEAFKNANTLAERAAITHAMISQFRIVIQEMAKFFDYKAGMMPRGNPTKFSLIYAVNALAALFEAENVHQRRAAINRYVSRDANRDDGVSFTGPFIEFVEGFFRWVDDSHFDWTNGGWFQDRIRRLTINRNRDPELYRLLDDQVSAETMLLFMKRAEEIK